MGDIGPPGVTLPGERGEKGLPGPVGKENSSFSHFASSLSLSSRIGVPGQQGLPGAKGEPGTERRFLTYHCVTLSLRPFRPQVDLHLKDCHPCQAHPVKRVIVV